MIRIGIWGSGWLGRGLGRGIVGWRRGGKAGGYVGGDCLRSIRDMAYRSRLLHTVRAVRILHLQALEDWAWD